MNERNDSTRVLVLTDEPVRTAGRPGGGLERRRALQDLADAGIKISEDGGGRLLVVEASDAQVRTLQEQIPGAKIIDLEEGFDQRVGEVDEQDALFVRALAIRVSSDYRELKRNQRPGETPEEQLLVSGPCTPPEG